MDRNHGVQSAHQTLKGICLYILRGGRS
jgi:hypothetical protein